MALFYYNFAEYESEYEKVFGNLEPTNNTVSTKTQPKYSLTVAFSSKINPDAVTPYEYESSD